MEISGLKDTTLLLFTEMFPFGLNSEQAFLSNEIKHLTDAFQKVIVFPQIAEGEQTTTGDFFVDLSLADFLHKRSKSEMLFIALKQSLLYREFFKKNILFWNNYRLKHLLFYMARQALVKKWLKSVTTIENSINSSHLLVYTYWNNEITTGLLGCKRQLQNAHFISRAHGHDLYEDYWDYLPCQAFNLKKLDRLFLVSQQALNYISTKYPEYRNKVILSHLGVEAAKKNSKKSTDGVIRVVSCSYIVKLKRINLIVLALEGYVKKFGKKLEWTHFGDGSQMHEITTLADSLATDCFSFNFPGFIPNEQITRYYQEHPVDFFIHLSESEGGVPVAIQEAQAHGIPVIAANAGGVQEIVNPETGILLSSLPCIADIIEAIHETISDERKADTMRNNCVLQWQKYYDANKNFNSFITELKNLLSE